MLEIKDVSRVYGEGEARIIALDGVSLSVAGGDFIAVMGPSGSGKSTLLNIIGGLERLSSGAVVLDGRRLDNLDEDALTAFRRGKISYVFQQYHLLPSLTALENVLLPLVFSGSVVTGELALAMLKRVGLERRVNHKPSQLSGGEQQRVAIARALVNRPSLVLADEPTGNMDGETGRDILALFKEINSEGQTIIMVTHNPEVAHLAGKTIFLKDGRLVNQV